MSNEGKRRRGAIAAAVVVFAVAGCSSGDPADDPQVRQQMAITQCEHWVKDKLKAPATADFTGESATGSGPWSVTGSVDSENSFGAKIRTGWSCTISLDGSTWNGSVQVG